MQNLVQTLYCKEEEESEFIKPKDIKDNSDKVQLSFHKMLEYVQRKELGEKEYGNQILLGSLKAKQTKNKKQKQTSRCLVYKRK